MRTIFNIWLCALILSMQCCGRGDLGEISWLFLKNQKYEMLFDGIVFEYTNDTWGEYRREKDILYEKSNSTKQDNENVKRGKAYILPKMTKIKVNSVTKRSTVTQSYLEIRFEILNGKQAGNFFILDPDWVKCRGDYLTDKVNKEKDLKGLTFHYPDPKYFKLVK